MLSILKNENNMTTQELEQFVKDYQRVYPDDKRTKQQIIDAVKKHEEQKFPKK